MALGLLRAGKGAFSEPPRWICRLLPGTHLVCLAVFKSYDAATAFLHKINRRRLGLLAGLVWKRVGVFYFAHFQILFS